jgi:hypothetical protein
MVVYTKRNVRNQYRLEPLESFILDHTLAAHHRCVDSSVGATNLSVSYFLGFIEVTHDLFVVVFVGHF